MDLGDEEEARLPDEFDIDLPISMLSHIVLARVPLSIHSILSFDNEIGKRKDREIWTYVYMYLN